MKGKYVREYTLTLSDMEMAVLVQGLRIYVRDYEVMGEEEELLNALEEIFLGDTGGRSIARGA